MHNLTQEQIFKAGGIALPKCDSLEDYETLVDILSRYKPPTGKLSDINPGKIQYNIPTRFLGDAND